MRDDLTVFIVDDDELALSSVKALVQSMGLNAEIFRSAESFLEAFHDDRPGCLVADVRLAGMSGIELMDLLRQRGCVLPVIVLTAFARTSLAVRAMQAGAVTVLDKPYEDNELWEAIRQALSADARKRTKKAEQMEYRRRLDLLNDSERDVLELVLAGKPNKSIAKILDVSTRTIENRRRSVYSKMEVETLADLVRVVLKADTSE